MHPRALEYKVYLAMGRLFATLKRACKEGVGYAAFVPRTRECFEECERRADDPCGELPNSPFAAPQSASERYQ